MYVAIAGSRHVNLQRVAPPAMQLLATLPDVVTLLIRKGNHRSPQPFEAMIERLASFRHIRVEHMVPELGRNRVGTYVRDVEMVDRSDAVLVFLDPSEDPMGDGGTAHILQRAVDANRPLYAYAVHYDGLQWIGGVGASERLTNMSDVASDILAKALTVRSIT